MDIETKRKCIFVLGMHRSGTSALTGVLQIMGLDLGKDLMEANEYNEKGYFEHNKVFALNEEIFARFGINWHTTYLLKEGWENTETAINMVEKIQVFFQSHFLDNTLFAIKDPRISVLLPLWKKALAKENIDASYLIIFRHPGEIVGSLSRPHPSLRQHATLLLIDYYLRLEASSRHDLRIFISFDNLLENTRSVISKLRKFLGEDFSPNHELISGFLNAKLRHYNPESRLRKDLIGLAHRLWTILQELEKTDGKTSWEKMDNLYQEHQKLLTEYGLAYHESIQDFRRDQVLLENENIQLINDGVVQERKDAKMELEKIAIEKDSLLQTITSIESKQEELQNEIRIYEEQSLLKEQKIDQLTASIQNSKNVLEEYETKIKDLWQKIHSLKKAVEIRDKEIEAQKRNIRLKDEVTSNEISKSLSNRKNQLLKLENQQKLLNEKQREIAVLKEVFQATQKHVSNLERDVENLRKSASFKIGWWLTRPLGVLHRIWTNTSWLRKSIKIFPALIKFSIQKPGEIFSILTRKNFVQLRKALSEEPLGKVLSNLGNYFNKAGKSLDRGDRIFSHDRQYDQFLQKHQLTSDMVNKIKKDCNRFAYKPLLSIVTPVYNTDPQLLEKCIKSVLEQYYNNWELCIFDDCSSNKETIKCLKNWKDIDPRIKIKTGTRNLHISKASNEAIELATGDFVGLLDHDDELSPAALYEVVKLLNRNPELDFIYSDEDKIEMNGTYSDPHFKSDYNLDLLLSHNYICHFAVIRKSLGDIINWFRAGFEGSQDYDLFLRIIEKTKNIHHIPKVLYHWRKVPESTAMALENKDYINSSSTNTLKDYMVRNGIKGEVLPGLFHGSWRIKRRLTTEKLVSIIIPFKDQVKLLRNCLESIFLKTSYQNYEIILVSNNSEENETFEFLSSLKNHSHIHIYQYDIPFNFSTINNWAVAKAQGDYVLFLNNDTEVITDGWLGAMLEHIQRSEVGAVGAKLYYPNDTIQHAGVVIGIGGIAAHVHNHIPGRALSYFGRASILQNLSACTAACLMVKKDIFKEVEGFNEEDLKIAFNDIDLCLKIRSKGFLIVFTPYCELYHHESVSRGYEDTLEKQIRFKSEIEFFKSKWFGLLEKGDPYYNPNLTLKRTDFSINDNE